jgi:L-cysteine:1D-myo-inositol 2-amino-2-deoxy-alpha-D-glucopyranoside ligase
LALATLGPDFDLQGGGGDLRFPHHEMCAAQAFTATGRPLARAYVQSAMVGLDGEKMSKSKGNLVLVSRLRERGVDPMAIRLALLAHHYRDDWSWTEEELQAAEQRLATWRAAVGQVDGPPVCATTGPPVTATNRANLPERDRADVPARDRADVLARDRADVPLVGAIRAALRDDLHADRALLAVDAWAQGGPDDPAERAEVAAAVDALLGVGLLA